MNRKKIVSIGTTLFFVLASFFLFYLIMQHGYQERWLKYKNKELGISFVYPSSLEEIHLYEYDSVSLSSRVNPSQSITIYRKFGFGDQKWIEDYLKSKNTSLSKKEIISVNGRQALAVFWPDQPNNKQIYIQVDDALMLIIVYGIDTDKFLENFKITKRQVSKEYRLNLVGGYKAFVSLNRGYQIDNLPSDFGFSVGPVKDSRFEDDQAVSLRDPYYQPGDSIGVLVDSSKHSSVENLIDTNENKIEGVINVDGYRAILTHPVSGIDGKIHEEFPEHKNVYVLRGDRLYIINIQYPDYKKVLKGFKFTDHKVTE